MRGARAIACSILQVIMYPRENALNESYWETLHEPSWGGGSWFYPKEGTTKVTRERREIETCSIVPSDNTSLTPLNLDRGRIRQADLTRNVETHHMIHGQEIGFEKGHRISSQVGNPSRRPLSFPNSTEKSFPFIKIFSMEWGWRCQISRRRGESRYAGPAIHPFSLEKPKRL